LALAEGEANRRDQTRIARALSEAHLPYGKSLTNFEFTHLPTLKPAMLMPFIEDTAWLVRAENLLLFGPSGVGKTHISAGVGQAMVAFGKRVKFLPATTLVQQLQQAKLQLWWGDRRAYKVERIRDIAR
jgi:DNA replication protein DnaC